jgi:hypothetical protein
MPLFNKKVIEQVLIVQEIPKNWQVMIQRG